MGVAVAFRGCGGCRRRRRRPDACRRREEWSRRFPGRCREGRGADRGGQELVWRTCLVERAAVGVEEKFHEGLESFGLLAEVAGGAEECCKLTRMGRGGWHRREQASGAQIANGALDVGPGSVLGEDGADDDFEASAAGPPVLRAVGGEECIEVRRQLQLRGSSGGERRGIGSKRRKRSLRRLRDSSLASSRSDRQIVAELQERSHLKGTIATQQRQVKEGERPEEQVLALWTGVSEFRTNAEIRHTEGDKFCYFWS